MRSSRQNKKRVEKRHSAVKGFYTFFDCMCRFLYIVGIQSIRILRRIRRKISIYLMPIALLIRHVYSITIGKQLQRIKKEISFLRMSIAGAKKNIKEAKKQGTAHAMGETFHTLHGSFALHKGILFTLLNIAVPVCCAFILFSVVHYWNGINYGLILTNNGKQIAVIQNEGVYEKATEMVNQRMVHDTVQEASGIKFAPGFQLTADTSSFSASGSVCDLLIKQSNGIIEEASGLYVDGKLMGAVKSGADLRFMLENLLNAAKGSEANVTARFTQNVEIMNGLYPTTSIISTDGMKKLICGTSQAGTTYTVKVGDTATSIARANNTTISELRKINKNLGDSIHPGDIINLQIAVPTMEVELVKTVTYEGIIPYTTITKSDDSQYTDYSKVLTQGVDGRQRCTDTIHTVNGVETKRETISKTILAQPVNKVVLTGTKKRPENEKGVASGKFMWPVPSLHIITTYFTWRWGEFHTGIDISGSSAYGSTIVAADGGTVTMAGSNDGYGYCIMINHGNGMSTLYGHCSKLLVSVGEQVSKGQAIGKVGSTGNSTGPHCHFEVIVGGTKVDPLKYVS